MCELLNKPSRRGGNQGSAGQTGGELQGNTEMFFESLFILQSFLSPYRSSAASAESEVFEQVKCVKHLSWQEV